jgi:GTPase SAR1 family protein
MGPSGLFAISDKLKLNRGLVELDVSDNPLIGPDISPLIIAIRFHPTLEMVRICACSVKPESGLLVELGETFRHNPNLVQLDLHHNYFHHEALRQYFHAMRESPVCRITKLDLDSMGVGIVAVKELVLLLNAMPSIRHVSLRKNVIGGPPIASFFRGIRHNTSLSYLNLARSRLRESDVKLIGDYLRESQSSLQELDISDNNLGKTAMDLIIEQWGRNKSLTSLSLGQNEFTGQDISRFLSFVSATNMWRAEFPFSSNPVTGITEQTHLLSTLDFMEMRVFEEKQAKDLAKLIESSPHIHKIVLYNCRMTEENTKMIIEAVKKSSALATIDIRGNSAAHDDLQDLATFYVTSPILARVHMDFSDPKRLLRCKNLSKLNLLEVPPSILKALHLVKLELKSNRLSMLPPDISKLTDLVSLDLRDNDLEMLPPEMGFLTGLKKLKLDGNPLRTPPQELRDSAGNKAGKILGYLRDLHHGQELVYRVKLMFVGQENVGKTTLLSLLKKKYKSKTFKVNRSFAKQASNATLMRSRSGKLEQFLSTDGIDINEIQIEIPMPIKHSATAKSGPFAGSSQSTQPSSARGSSSSLPGRSGFPSASGSSASGLSSLASASSLAIGGSASLHSNVLGGYEKRTITLSTWDFGGQDIYYSTHQFFLSDHSIFLVVWDLRYEEEKSRVGFWLQSIQARTTSAPVIIIGTHSDDPSCANGVAQKKIDAVRHKYRKYKMVKAVIAMSCVTGDLSDLMAALTTTIQDLPTMGMTVPSSYMALSAFIRQYRQANDSQREEMMAFSNAALAAPLSSAALPSIDSDAQESRGGSGGSEMSHHQLQHMTGSSSSATASNQHMGHKVPLHSAPLASTAAGGSAMLTGASAVLFQHGSSGSHGSPLRGGPRRASSSSALSSSSSSSSSSVAGSNADFFGRTPLLTARPNALATVPYKTWSEFAQLAKFCHINDGPDLKRCAETLNLMGDIVYFDDPKTGLDDLVILDSQYLTHIMSTIVTTKQNYVKNGVLNYNDLRHIWKPPLFPINIHPYLLAILEKFEIVYTANRVLANRLVEYFGISAATKSPAYPMHGLGVIPSLLPEAVPVLDVLWGKFDEKILEFDRQYVFDLMPTGLFSRLIVRLLHTATEVLHCWRNGTVFLARDSICLAELNPRHQCISVTVRGGTNPAEQLRIITEVIEALILIDTWWKANIKRRVSCVSCLHQLTTMSSTMQNQASSGTNMSINAPGKGQTSNPASPETRRHGFAVPSDESSTNLLLSPRSVGGSDPATSSESSRSTGPLSSRTHVSPTTEGTASAGSSFTHTPSPLAAAPQPGPSYSGMSDGVPSVYDHKRGRSSSGILKEEVIDPLDPLAPYRRGSSINIRSGSGPLRKSNDRQLPPQSSQGRTMTQASSSPKHSHKTQHSKTSSSSKSPKEERSGYKKSKSSEMSSHSPPPSPRTSHEQKVESSSNSKNDDTVASSKRPPSIGQIRAGHRHYKGDSSSKGANSSPSNPSTSRTSVKSLSLSVSAATVNDAGSSVMSASSTAGSPGTSSENLLWGSANMEVEPCYFTIEDCERAASEGRAFLTCDAGHLVRLDRVAPDVALTDFEGNRIDNTELELMPTPLGKGSFGEIYKAHYRGEIVAVKRLFCDPIELSRIYSTFRREVWIMSGLGHPNLVNLRGYCLDPSPSMVMEFVSGGDLYSFLHKEDKLHSDSHSVPRLDAALVLKIALDVANGIRFLHSATPPFIHRDLKSPNILLMDNPDPFGDIVAKVADFGLTSRMVIPLRREGRSDRAVVNPTWLAPEIMREEAFSEKSDTYAFGIILWELYTREHPYANLLSNFLHEVEDAVLSNQRPPIPRECPQEYANLMTACWADNPDERPSFTEIVDSIYIMIEKSGYGGRIRASATQKNNSSSSSAAQPRRVASKASPKSKASVGTTELATGYRKSPPARRAKVDDTDASGLVVAMSSPRRIKKSSKATGSRAGGATTTKESAAANTSQAAIVVSDAGSDLQASEMASMQALLAQTQIHMQLHKKMKRRSAPSRTMSVKESAIGTSASSSGGAASSNSHPSPSDDVESGSESDLRQQQAGRRRSRSKLRPGGSMLTISERSTSFDVGGVGGSDSSLGSMATADLIGESRDDPSCFDVGRGHRRTLDGVGEESCDMSSATAVSERMADSQTFGSSHDFSRSVDSSSRSKPGFSGTTPTVSERSDDSIASSTGTPKHSSSSEHDKVAANPGATSNIHITAITPAVFKGITRPPSNTGLSGKPSDRKSLPRGTTPSVTATFTVSTPHALRRPDSANRESGNDAGTGSTGDSSGGAVSLTGMLVPSETTVTADTDTFPSRGLRDSALSVGRTAKGEIQTFTVVDALAGAPHHQELQQGGKSDSEEFFEHKSDDLSGDSTLGASSRGYGSSQRKFLLLSSTMSQEEETDSEVDFDPNEKHSFSSTGDGDSSVSEDIDDDSAVPGAERASSSLDSGERSLSDERSRARRRGDSGSDRSFPELNGESFDELDLASSHQSRPQRSNQRRKTSSSSSMDVELNPVFAGTANALVGRFTKQLAVRPQTRINNLFPVGNAHVWGTGRDGSVHVWNAKNGELLSTHPGAHQGSIKTAAPVLDTVWMSCPKTHSLGVWHVKIADTGSRVERRYGTLNVGVLKDAATSKIGHWRKRFVVINFKDGSLKLFSTKETKDTSTMFDMPTPTSAPIKELSLISTPSHPVSFGLAVEHNERSFKVSSGATTLYFELESVHDMLEWLDCIASSATGEQLVCLTTLKNEWTRNIGVMHVPSVKGELLITGSNDAELEVVSWNVHTKRVNCGTRLASHLDFGKRSHASSAGASSSAAHEHRSSGSGSNGIGNGKSFDEGTAQQHSSSGEASSGPLGASVASLDAAVASSAHIVKSKTHKCRISGIVTIPKLGYTLVAAGSFVFVLNTKTLEVVHKLRSHKSNITAMALTRPKEIWTATADGTIVAWDASSFTQITQFKYPSQTKVKCIIPCTATAVWTADADGLLRIWDSTTHTLTSTLQRQHTGAIQSLTLWHHSLWASSNDRSVSIWT